MSSLKGRHFTAPCILHSIKAFGFTRIVRPQKLWRPAASWHFFIRQNGVRGGVQCFGCIKLHSMSLYVDCWHIFRINFCCHNSNTWSKSHLCTPLRMYHSVCSILITHAYSLTNHNFKRANGMLLARRKIIMYDRLSTLKTSGNASIKNLSRVWPWMPL